MKKILIFAAALVVISCGGNGSKLVDLSDPIGDTITFVDENGDSVTGVVTDTMIVNDTIYSNIVSLSSGGKENKCSVYDSLKYTIHRGENCRTNNSAALAIAKANNDTKKVAYFEKMNEDAERDGKDAEVKLKEHLKTCELCKRLNNK